MSRIVSLIPSATEIVHALELGSHQVGRSHECDFPSSVLSLPVCTAPRFPISGDSRDIDDRVQDLLKRALAVYEVLEETLRELEPSHILTQTQCDVCAVSLKDVEQAVGRSVSSAPQVVSLLAHSLPEVWEDVLAVARALDREERGRALRSEWTAAVEKIRARAAQADTRPEVVCLEWLEPLMAAGNWMPELVDTAGGTNRLAPAGVPSRYTSWESVVEADPEILVLLPCGFDMARTQGELHWLTARKEWASLRAVRGGRVYLTDGNQYFNRPGPRLVESARILAEIIHPERFSPSFEGRAWSRLKSG